MHKAMKVCARPYTPIPGGGTCLRETGFGDRIVIEIDDPVKIVDVMEFLKSYLPFGMKVVRREARDCGRQSPMGRSTQ